MGVVSLRFVIAIGIIFGCSTSRWFMLVFIIELIMFSVVFIAYEAKLLRQVTACIKYFFVQTLSRVFLFIGGLILTLTMCDHFITTLLIVIGLFLKLGVFPFYFWVVPVNSTLPYSMTGLISRPAKVLPLVILISFYQHYLIRRGFYLYVVLVVGVGSILVGIYLGLLRASLRRILGASSVAHTGWLIVALPCGTVWHYFCLYSVRLLALIICLNALNTTVTALRFLRLGGMPPFRVFTGKLVVLCRYLGNSLPIGFLVTRLLTSVIRLFYYIKFGLVFYIFPNSVTRLSILGFLLIFMNLSISFMYLIFFYGRVGDRFLLYSR